MSPWKEGPGEAHLGAASSTWRAKILTLPWILLYMVHFLNWPGIPMFPTLASTGTDNLLILGEGRESQVPLSPSNEEPFVSSKKYTGKAIHPQQALFPI